MSRCPLHIKSLQHSLCGAYWLRRASAPADSAYLMVASCKAVLPHSFADDSIAVRAASALVRSNPLRSIVSSNVLSRSVRAISVAPLQLKKAQGAPAAQMSASTQRREVRNVSVGLAGNVARQHTWWRQYVAVNGPTRLVNLSWHPTSTARTPI